MSEREGIQFVIPGQPVAFARAGRNGKFSFTPTPQRNFMAVVRDFAAQEMAGREPLTGPVRLTLEAEYIPPASWSKRKQTEANWKTSKPDADNIYKLVADSLNGVAYVDDAQIADVRITKTYAGVSRLSVSVEPLA